MDFLLEVAVSAFFLAAMSAVGFLFFWRVRGIERQMSMLLKAALTNTREIRHCVRRVDEGFSEARKSENHRRVLLASLNSQMSELNQMMAARMRRDDPDPTAHWPAAASRTQDAAESRGAMPAGQASKAPLRVVTGAGRDLPGYRVIRKSAPERVVSAEGAEAVRQRKIQKIEELFRKVELPVAAAAGGGETPMRPARPANDVGAAPQSATETPFSKFAELISQRRRVVNG